MKRIILAIALLALWRAGSASAQESHYLSHIANGAVSEGSFRTTFVIFNNTNTDLTANVKLTGDGGAPLTLTIAGIGSQSEFSVFVPAGGTQILQTDGSGALVTGAAAVSAPAGIGVSAVFGIYDRNGNFVTEAGVGSAPQLTNFVAPVDTTGQFNTGLALFNPGNNGTSITVILQDTSGNMVDQTTLSLPARGHLARFVAGGGQLFPAAAGVRGTLLVRSDSPVAALVLRQNQEPLSYTSLPVVATGSSRTTLNLAQVANGSFQSGSFRTTFLIFNLSATPSVVSLSLTSDDGSPFPVTIPDYGTRSTFTFTLQPSGSVFLQTDGSGPLTAGAATIVADAPVGASGIFTVFDDHGAFQTEAGVGDSQVMSASTLPVDIAPGFDTGVAFFNPSVSSTTVKLKLLDVNGALYDPGTSIDLVRGGHTAKFVSQLFPGVGSFRGSLTVLAPSGVAALTLRQNTTPLSYTTLPVVAGAAAGKAPPAPVLPDLQAGIAAASDITIDRVLANGFRLTGHINAPGSVGTVIARRADGKIFSGVFDPDTGRYLIAVAAGTYTLKVSYQVVDASGLNRVSLAYVDASPVQVTEDTTRHITLPSPQLFGLTGNVAGLERLPEQTDAAVVFTSPDNLIQAAFPVAAGGGYAGALPNGNYQSSVIVPLVSFTGIQNQSLALYNLGSVNLDGGPVALNLTIPATARISGAVRAGWLTGPAFGIQVSAADRTAPTVSDFDLISAPSTNVADADTAGQYQIALIPGRAYDFGLTLPYFDGSRRLGTISYLLPTNPVTPGSVTIVDFPLPDLPVRVTIKGRITDTMGVGLADVGVTASTQAVTGAPGMGFSASTLTDANGNYSLSIFSGSGYQLQAVPPKPLP